MQDKLRSGVSMTRIMLNKYFRFKKGRLLLIFLSIIIGSSAVASLLSVYMDIDVKMRKELRTYGANLIASKVSGTDGDGRSLRLSQREQTAVISSFVKGQVIAAGPYIFGIAEYDNSRFPVVGVDKKEFAKLSPYIRKVSSINDRPGDGAIIGKSLANSIGLRAGDKLTLTNSIDSNKKLVRTVVSVIESGDEMDDQLITDHATVAKFMGLQKVADYVALSYTGDDEALAEANRKLKGKASNIKITPINKISRSEASLLTKISSLTLFIALAILLSAILATAITLASMVFERRYEIGVKKALGASNKDIVVEMAGESLLTGAIGGIIGWISGMGIAQVIGYSLFSSYISVRPVTLLITVLTALAIGGLASIFPLRAVLKVEPAQVLRNE